MLDGRLDQEADEVGILQHRARGDHRAGDLDLVERQDIDQRRRRPFGGGELVGESLTDFAFGAGDQPQEDGV